MKKFVAAILSFLTLSTLLVVSPSFASTTITQSIHGNPIGRRDDYTINSNQTKTVAIMCVFTNTGKEKAELNIWTAPTQMKPRAKIHFDKGNKNTPDIIKKMFPLKLASHWWCRIYIPQPSTQWQRCAYFSISDATITENNPFATWNKTIHSKHTRYDCHIRPPDNDVSFFYFKK